MASTLSPRPPAVAPRNATPKYLRDAPSVVEAFLYKVYVKLSGWVHPKRTARTFFGCEIQCDVRDLLQKRVYFFKIWEPQLTSLMLERVHPGNVVVDVGANVGYFTALMAQLVGPMGRVISIEASPFTFKHLQDTIRRNNYANVVPTNVAISQNSGEIDLLGSPASRRNLGNVGTVPRGDSIKLGTVRCDSFINIVRDRAPDISFVKVDIEGAERPLLTDILLHKHLFNRPFTLVAEISAKNQDLIPQFAAAGFDCRFLENDYSFVSYMAACRNGKPDLTHSLDPISTGSVGKREGDFVFTLD